MNERGLTLIEALVALAILGIAAVAIMPAFMTQLDSNRRSETRSGAVTASQQVLEGLRLADPASLPTTGAGAPQTVTVGDRTYEVTTFYCLQAALCDARSRHLRVEVSHDGRVVYDVETVFTQLL